MHSPGALELAQLDRIQPSLIMMEQSLHEPFARINVGNVCFCKPQTCCTFTFLGLL